MPKQVLAGVGLAGRSPCSAPTGSDPRPRRRRRTARTGRRQLGCDVPRIGASPRRRIPRTRSRRRPRHSRSRWRRRRVEAAVPGSTAAIFAAGGVQLVNDLNHRHRLHARRRTQRGLRRRVPGQRRRPPRRARLPDHGGARRRGQRSRYRRRRRGRPLPNAGLAAAWLRVPSLRTGRTGSSRRDRAADNARCGCDLAATALAGCVDRPRLVATVQELADREVATPALLSDGELTVWSSSTTTSSWTSSPSRRPARRAAVVHVLVPATQHADARALESDRVPR